MRGDFELCLVRIFFKVVLNFCLSHCSGLVVSGYSKIPTDKSLNTKFTQAIDGYKNIKRNYFVGMSDEFQGKRIG